MLKKALATAENKTREYRGVTWYGG